MCAQIWQQFRSVDNQLESRILLLVWLMLIKYLTEA